MTTQVQEFATEQMPRVIAAQSDAIKTVPLHLPGGEATPVADLAQTVAGATPHLVYNHGPLLTAVQVYTIFWGPKWAQQQPLMQQLNAFFDFILSSTLIDQLAEYSVPAFQIGHGQRIGSILLPTPVPHISVTDSGVRHLLQHEIATNAQIPQPTPNTLYFVYVQPGVRVIQRGGHRASRFVATTIRLVAGCSTRQCRTRAARAAPAISPPSTP
jgi:hypothetical protein